MTENTSEGKERRKHSRRDFLKIFGLGSTVALASTLLPDTNSNTVAGNLLTRGVASLIARGGEEEALATEAQMVKEAGEKGNPYYWPYLDVIKDSVEEFQSKNPDVPIMWEKNEKYLSDYDVFGLLTTPISKEELFSGEEWSGLKGRMPVEYILLPMSEDTARVYGIFFRRLPKELREAVNVANTEMVAIPGTQLYIENYPDYGNVFYDDDVYNYYEQIKRDLEEIYRQQDSQKPLSMSKLLVYFLEENEGKLQPSLGDMAGFLKYMVRAYWGQGTRETKPQIDWLKTHVQDQINKSFSLNDLPPMDSLSDEAISIWGVVYHVPYMVYMLSYLSPDIVRAAAMYEYVSHEHVAEAYKAKIDAEAMDGLNDVFAYLQSFREH